MTCSGSRPSTSDSVRIVLDAPQEVGGPLFAGQDQLHIFKPILGQDIDVEVLLADGPCPKESARDGLVLNQR